MAGFAPAGDAVANVGRGVEDVALPSLRERVRALQVVLQRSVSGRLNGRARADRNTMLIDVRASMTRTRNAIAALGGDVAIFEIGPPATAAQLDAIERQMATVIPAPLRQLFVEQAATLRMLWTLDNPRHITKSLSVDLAGSIDLSLQDLPTDLLNWSAWRAAFESPVEHGLSPELTVEDYEELFPVVAAANGDQIVVADPQRNSSDAVVYLNHEANDFNFVILADRLEDFLNTWLQLGCVGPEWWTLAPFLDQDTFYISLETRQAKAWLRTLAAVA